MSFLGAQLCTVSTVADVCCHCVQASHHPHAANIVPKQAHSTRITLKEGRTASIRSIALLWDVHDNLCKGSEFSYINDVLSEMLVFCTRPITCLQSNRLDGVGGRSSSGLLCRHRRGPLLMTAWTLQIWRPLGLRILRRSDHLLYTPAALASFQRFQIWVVSDCIELAPYVKTLGVSCNNYFTSNDYANHTTTRLGKACEMPCRLCYTAWR